MSEEVPARHKQRLLQRSSDVRELNNTHFGGYLITTDSLSNMMVESEALTQSTQRVGQIETVANTTEIDQLKRAPVTNMTDERTVQSRQSMKQIMHSTQIDLRSTSKPELDWRDQLVHTAAQLTRTRPSPKVISLT